MSACEVGGRPQRRSLQEAGTRPDWSVVPWLWPAMLVVELDRVAATDPPTRVILVAPDSDGLECLAGLHTSIRSMTLIQTPVSQRQPVTEVIAKMQSVETVEGSQLAATVLHCASGATYLIDSGGLSVFGDAVRWTAASMA